jgi:hypothetical protein
MRKVIAMAAALILLLAGTGLAGWSGASTDQPISYQTVPQDSLDVKTASFCVGNNGELYAIYAQGEPHSPYLRELYFSKSLDGGYTWSGTTGNVIINASDGQNVYQSGNKKYTDIAVDSEDRIFVIWCEDYQETGIREIMLIYSTDGGDTWANSSADVPISCPTGEAYDANKPALIIDPNDNLHVVWNQKSSAAYNNYEILYSKSTDHGLTWTGQASDREISFRNSVPAWDPDIACDSFGNLYVVWREGLSTAPSYPLQFGKSTDGGVSFSSETGDFPISLPYKETGDASIHIDADDNIHVVYKGSIDVSPLTKLSLYTGSTDGGVTWSGNDSLVFIDYGPEGGINSWNPDITSSSTGVLIAVYGGGNPSTGRNDIWASYSYDGGVTWSGNTNPDLVSLPDYTVGSYVPYIGIDSEDMLHVVFREGLTSLSYEDMYYSRGDTLVGGAPMGWISGTVTDAITTNPIDSVHVIAEGTISEAFTDTDGLYILSELTPGDYTITFTHDNYQDTSILNISVTAGDTTELNLAMTPAAEIYYYLPGDANMGVGQWPPQVIGGDVTYMIGYFRGINPPCLLGGFYCAADANGDCMLIGSDVTKMVNYFRALTQLSYCQDFPPAWLSPGDCPDEPPEGWP